MVINSIFPFQTVFSTVSKKEIVILVTFILSSANAFNLVTSKISSFGKRLNVTEIIFSVHSKIENIVGKGENAGYQHFLLFP